MTTDHELLAMIDDFYPHESLIWKALRAVVAREEKPIADNRADELLESARGDGNIDDAFERGLEIGEMYGYNQCLADIKADIKKELG